ncbi:ROK family protein [Egicoccus sp. AB-alg2]|uniref:ROK family protein n=1 Tax=Egicoccus sp. AB-alg2 TaxID=3242693 RepID=UPI00359CC12D
MNRDRLAVGVDLGGTSLRVGLVPGDGRLLARDKVPTPPEGADAVLERIAGLVRDVADERWGEVAAVGVGIPAAVAPDTGAAALVPNVPGLEGRRVAEALASRLRRPVHADNDVALAVVGERWCGAAVGHDDVVLLSLGTGAGAGIVSGGRLVTGHRGAAGEIADLPLPGPVAQRDGTWFEAAVGTPALRRRAAEAGPWDGAPALLDAVGRGDAAAARVLDAWAGDVALAAMTLVAVLDPSLLVLGGGIGRRPEVVEAVTGALGRLTSRAPEVVAGTLGDWAGVVGAASQAVPSASAAGDAAGRQEHV